MLTTPLLRPWLTTASRFSVAPPPCVFGALSCSIVDSNRHGRRDLSCFSCSRHRCFIGGTGSLALPGGFAAISVVPSTAYRERVDPRRGCSASARCGLLFRQSFLESSPSGRSRGVPSRQASGSESLRPTVPPVFRPSSPSGLSEASAAQGAPLDISRGPTNLRSDSFIRSVVSRFGSSQSGNKNGAPR